ncbi:2Fe-2S iron-sulfur cluster-binding protein [Marinitenerispora sediminis]|uniref:2Fe-2S ferredoxin-type domain-containing protein n=1 Tax=Marinitenerispora sediminis TaxID=1931232 RepID=A0A368T2F7_9ACTN|nr:2Fe-2S iron-sulfur cluster-binding protein [Marinitenerispora sediminis]RCV50189.1 hypothetical protein DEF24_24505 [Marinitenerispora sediminis]RCV52266.1 hypothetical protein DEF28_13515 [Marinitenerispora sediminis]RCV56895.1 hypothetical protein DEF23_11875 [Marinitenerispora sediminis]
MLKDGQDRGGTADAPVTIQLRIDGVRHTVRIEPHMTLLDTVREVAGRPDLVRACADGRCGGCPVFAEGRRIAACTTLAAVMDDASVTLAPPGPEGRPGPPPPAAAPPAPDTAPR